MVGGNDSNSLQLQSNSSNRDRLGEMEDGAERRRCREKWQRQKGNHSAGCGISATTLDYLDAGLKGQEWCFSLFFLLSTNPVKRLNQEWIPPTIKSLWPQPDGTCLSVQHSFTAVHEVLEAHMLHWVTCYFITTNKQFIFESIPHTVHQHTRRKISGAENNPTQMQ